VPAQKGMNRDDIVPVSLGGVNTNPANIKSVPTRKNPAQFETEIAAKVKRGEMSLAEGRLAVMKYKQDQVNKPSLLKRGGSVVGDVGTGFKQAGQIAAELPVGLYNQYAKPSEAVRQVETAGGLDKRTPFGAVGNLVGKGLTRTFVPGVEGIAQQVGGIVGEKQIAKKVIEGKLPSEVLTTNKPTHDEIFNAILNSVNAVATVYGTAKAAKSVPKDIVPDRVVQRVTQTGAKEFFTLSSKHAPAVIDAIDNSGGIIAKDAQGGNYHITAKTPKQMEAAGFTYKGLITPEALNKSLTLNAGINPGIDKLIESDIKPAAKGISKIFQETKNKLSPQYASPEATAIADEVRKAKATIANAATLEETKFKDITKHFDKFSEQQNIQNIGAYERTGQFANEPTSNYSKFYKQSTDAAHQILRDVYKDPVGYVDNYVKRQFKFGSVADEQAATNYFQEKYSKFATDKSPTKERVFDVPLDKALTEMKQLGIDVKPVTTNPETLRQWTVANARHAQVFEDLRKLALETKDPNVARILNNATSQGLENSPTFRGIRALNNAINQVQLGLSAFHGTGTAINAGISDMALGLRQLAKGKFTSGAKSFGRSLLPGASFVRDIIKGDQFLKALKQDHPLAIETLDKINSGGGRIATETQYTNKSLENMTRAFKEGNLIGGTARIPFAIIEQVAKPLMSKAIPRVKIATYLDLVADIDKRLPTATEAVKAREYAKAWDSVDNRFGQLVYDNLFWDKTAQQLAQVSTRSVGWNLGTIREVGGGITDVFSKTLKGKGVSERTIYAAALPIYAAIIGVVYQYLHTGEKPKQVIDYFYPKNGLTTKDGQEDRVSLPTYMKDVFAYSKDPLGTIGHKASPLLSMAVDLASNRDYYGDMVRNPADPISKQLQQVGAYALTQFKPFTVTNLNKANQENARVSQRIEAFFGFNKAPGSVINPGKVFVPRAPRTPEQKAKAKLKQK